MRNLFDALDSNGGHLAMLLLLVVMLLSMWSFSHAPLYERLIDVFAGALLGILRPVKQVETKP
jgi:pilus assembly protein TadC